MAKQSSAAYMFVTLIFDLVPLVVGCEMKHNLRMMVSVGCPCTKAAQKAVKIIKKEDQPLGILPVPRHVGQVSPAEVPLMAPYGGKYFRVFTLSIPLIISDTSVVLLFFAGVTIAPLTEEKKRRKWLKYSPKTNQTTCCNRKYIVT